MTIRQFHKIDLTTGERLDVLLFDDEVYEVPEDLKEGWADGFYNPIWSFELDKWIEGRSLEEILAPVKERKVAELKDECNREIEKGFTHNGNFFQFTQLDQSNFTQQLTLMLLDTSINEVEWKTENNAVQIFTREEFIEACKSGEAHKRNNIGRYRFLKEQVETSNTVEEVNAISFVTPEVI